LGEAAKKGTRLMSREREAATAPVARAAERVLTREWAASVRLGHIVPLTAPERKNVVLRCHLVEAPSGTPATVIVKRAGRRGYDPDDPGSPAWLLFNEWAGSTFACRLPGDGRGGPQVYGGDRLIGVLVLEDVAGEIARRWPDEAEGVPVCPALLPDALGRGPTTSQPSPLPRQEGRY
jgi:hypothetical protein